ncbi:hypothetical protein ASZ90_015938 [hydrocarbon metagenome]|uniref:Uncharacterized protein n=1 Tax=hydrocarbon metagenome TaxID=938273 RepID=A0A0W8F102_9ZZZZ
MSQLVDCLGEDPPPIQLRVVGHPVAPGPEPEGGDERPSRRGNAEHIIQARGEDIHFCDTQGEFMFGMDDCCEIGEKPARQVLVPFFPEVTGGEREGRGFLHRGRKDPWEIFLQPGEGVWIRVAERDEGDSRPCCHTGNSAGIRLIDSPRDDPTLKNYSLLAFL